MKSRGNQEINKEREEKAQAILYPNGQGYGPTTQ